MHTTAQFRKERIDHNFNMNQSTTTLKDFCKPFFSLYFLDTIFFVALQNTRVA